MDNIPPPAVAPAPHAPVAARALKGNGGLFLIAVFELVKAVLFLFAAAGVLHLVKRDTQVELTKLLHVFRINGDWRFVKMLLVRADLIDPYKVRISIFLGFYAALHATEGIGLLLRKHWAEYFTIIMTAIWIPLEIFALVHHTTHSRVANLVPQDQRPELLFTHWEYLKIAALVGNVAIVWYLAYHLRRDHQRAREARTATPLPAPREVEDAGQPGR